VRHLLLLALALAAPAAAQQGQPPFVVQETGQGYWRIDDAVNAIADG
jgi:hypothetical protein